MTLVTKYKNLKLLSNLCTIEVHKEEEVESYIILSDNPKTWEREVYSFWLIQGTLPEGEEFTYYDTYQSSIKSFIDEVLDLPLGTKITLLLPPRDAVIKFEEISSIKRFIRNWNKRLRGVRV